MFSGCFTALITPFRHNQLDESALRKLVRFQLDQGIHGLVPLGTTGESPTLTEHEHKRVVDIVVQETAGQVPVIAGAGSNNPQEAILYARHGQQAGADAVLAVAGYYNRPSQEGLFRHFEALHDATDLPVVVYNIPSRTLVDIEPATMARIAGLPRVVGVKDACGNLGRICLERSLITRPFSFLSGDDLTALAYNANGGTGCISVTANVLPGQCARLQTLCAQQNFAAALALHEQLVPLHDALFREPSPAGIKFAASLLELCSEECRLPMVLLDETTRQLIRQTLQQVHM